MCVCVFLCRTMEFEHVGKQCQLDSCSQHGTLHTYYIECFSLMHEMWHALCVSFLMYAYADFMPIQCEYCRKYFCEEHYTLDNHQCPCLPERNNLPQAEKDEINSRVFQRAMEAIQKVRHESKMRDEQSAATNGGSKSASGAGVGATTTRGGRKKASEILKEKRNQKRQHSPAAEEEATSIDWTQQKPEAKPLTEAARKRKQKVAMMKIKTKASNSREIPEGEKLYFYIKFDSSVGFTSASSIPGYDGKMQQLSICLSKYWTIGRVIDYISAKTEVRNSNNATNDEVGERMTRNATE